MSAFNEIKKDLNRLEANKAPINTADSLSRMMGLQGSIPDGKSLRRRLFERGEENDRTGLRNVLALTSSIAEKMPYRRGNVNEELFAAALVGVALRQYDREGDICPIAKDLLLSAGTGREDLVPRTTMDRLVESVRINQIAGEDSEISETRSGIVVVTNRFKLSGDLEALLDKFFQGLD